VEVSMEAHTPETVNCNLIDVCNNDIIYPVNLVGNNLLRIVISGHKFVALLDSGSDICVVPTHVMLTIDPDLSYPPDTIPHVSIRAAGGTHHKISAMHRISFLVGEMPCTADFYEVPHVEKIILGITFMEQYKIIMDFDKKLVTFPPHVRIAHEPDIACASIQPGSFQLVKGRVKSSHIDTSQTDGLLVEIPDTKVSQGRAVIKGAVATICDGTVPLLVANISTETIDLDEERFEIQAEIMDEDFCILNISKIEHMENKEQIYCNSITIQDETITGNTPPTNNDFDIEGPRRFGPEDEFIFPDHGRVDPPKKNPHRTITEEQLQATIGDRKPADMMDFNSTAIKGELLEQCKRVINNYTKCFIMSDSDFGYNADYPLKITLKQGMDTPTAQRPYRLSPQQVEIAREQLQKWEDLGVIQSYLSAWNHPAFLVKKKFNKSHQHLPEYQKVEFDYRLVVDFRLLNSKVAFTSLATPSVDETLDTLGRLISNLRKGCDVILHTEIDLPSAYFQLAVDEDSIGYLAFKLGDEIRDFKAFTTLPMGFRYSSSLLYLVMVRYLGDMARRNLVFYADDLLLLSPLKSTQYSYYQIVADLDEFLRNIARSGLKLHPSKMKVGLYETNFLGHQITGEGMSISPKHVRALKNFPPPRDKSELIRFLGLVNYFNKHLKDRGHLVGPLTKLMRKDQEYIWDEEQQKCFDEIIRILTGDGILAHPDFDETFFLMTDASQRAIGAVLMQKPTGKLLRVIGYYGVALNRAQSKYGVPCLELLAACKAMLHFKFYLSDKHFVLLTDHASLRQVLTQANNNPLLRRLSLTIQYFQFTIRHVAGTTLKIPDALSRARYIKEYDFDWEQAVEHGVLLTTPQQRKEAQKALDEEDDEEDVPMPESLFEQLHLPITEREVRMLTRGRLRAAGQTLDQAVNLVPRASATKGTEEAEDEDEPHTYLPDPEAPLLRQSFGGRSSAELVKEAEKTRRELS